MVKQKTKTLGKVKGQETVKKSAVGKPTKLNPLTFLRKCSILNCLNIKEKIMTFAPTTTSTAPVTPAETIVYPVRRRKACSDAALNKIDPFLFELLDMLTIRRRDKTQTEVDFCKEYMNGIVKNDGKFVKFNTLKDPVTGEVLAYYYKATNDPVLWSSHVDSVHVGAGNVKVAFDPYMLVAYVEDQKTPLGADDAAGMWLLFQMIRAGVGGTYIFHKAEEVGGIGSRGVAKHHSGFLSAYDYAIAFDRKANTSVITHQGGMRCCSEKFADSIISILNKQPNMAYVKDDGGVFTDTKNYINHIAECTNLSCGYTHEHTVNETLDVAFLVDLKNALVASFIGGFSHLVKSRKAGEVESKWKKTSETSVFNSKNKTGKTYGSSSVKDAPFWCQAYDFEDDLMFETRQQYYSKDVVSRGKTSSFNKTTNALDLLLDKKEMEVIYFNMHDMTMIEMQTDELEILESQEYIEYDELITGKITKLGRMDKESLKKELIRLDVGELVSVVKKLISEAGY